MEGDVITLQDVFLFDYGMGVEPTSGANCSYTGIKVLSARLPDGSGVS